MKIRPVGAELFHSDGQTGGTEGHDGVISLFFQVLRMRLKMMTVDLKT